jgi:hypothetical protein
VEVEQSMLKAGQRTVKEVGHHIVEAGQCMEVVGKHREEDGRSHSSLPQEHAARDGAGAARDDETVPSARQMLSVQDIVLFHRRDAAKAKRFDKHQLRLG